jgi:hypothetical protein
VDNSVLEIIAYGAWNGGMIVDNSIYEKKARLILNDSVGAGMTRSSFLQKL